MYTKMNNPRIIIYDGDTKELIGTAKFDLSPSAENDLLQLVNYNTPPSSLLLLNLNLYEPAENYTRPEPYFKYVREGKIKASFTDLYTKNQIPLEIIIKYNVRANSANPKNLEFYDSVIFDGIEVISIKRVSDWAEK